MATQLSLRPHPPFSSRHTLPLLPCSHRTRNPLIPISHIWHRFVTFIPSFSNHTHFGRYRSGDANYYFVSKGLWESPWLTCFNVSWRLLSQIISFYLIFLNLVAKAHDYPTPSTYACEDITNYYSHVKHLRGEALKKKLNTIVAPHHSLSYKEVWNALKFLDAADVDKPDASLGIVEIYSLRVVPKRLSGKPRGWNINASRGNKYYGECDANSTKCLKPANKEAALDTETDKERWAPPMKVRGDIARALMYMEVCYGFQQSGRIQGLRLSDTPNIENKEMGVLSTLLKWNAVDPPSREEKLRNERICKFYQHNRNPFVDHPEYANLIWEQLAPRRAPKHSNNNNVSLSTTKKS